MYDMIIRNGTIVDGSGAPRFQADIAISNGVIVEIGRHIPSGQSEMDVSGLLVTPGWVDVHSHYDWQAVWDPFLTPSSYHGVTTVVMGNCGFGIAPVRKEDRSCMASIMEHFIDIPAKNLLEGRPWLWESFSEYMNVLGRKSYVMDVAAQVSHCAVRIYAMGEERAYQQDIPSDDELRLMEELVSDSMKEGAVGITSSRTVLHKDSYGRVLPGTRACFDELLALGRGLSQHNTGVFSFMDGELGSIDQLEMLKALADQIKRPVTFNLPQDINDPNRYKNTLRILAGERFKDSEIYAQTLSRPQGGIVSLRSSIHPFSSHKAFSKFKHLSHDLLVAELSKPSVQRQLLDEEVTGYQSMLTRYAYMFPFENEINYEPQYDESVEAIAKREAVNPGQWCIEWLLRNQGTGMLFAPLMDYANYSLDHIHEILSWPKAYVGFGDGGAHNGFLCDAGQPTFLLTYWCRDRPFGKKFSLEQVVKMQTSDPARLFGFNDRGMIKKGSKADVNIIDFNKLKLLRPEIVYDIPGPAGVPRVIQKAEGYIATIVNGIVTHQEGIPTGALPGVLMRRFGAPRKN